MPSNNHQAFTKPVPGRRPRAGTIVACMGALVTFLALCRGEILAQPSLPLVDRKVRRFRKELQEVLADVSSVEMTPEEKKEYLATADDAWDLLRRLRHARDTAITAATGLADFCHYKMNKSCKAAEPARRQAILAAMEHAKPPALREESDSDSDSDDEENGGPSHPPARELTDPALVAAFDRYDGLRDGKPTGGPTAERLTPDDVQDVASRVINANQDILPVLNTGVHANAHAPATVRENHFQADTAALARELEECARYKRAEKLLTQGAQLVWSVMTSVAEDMAKMILHRLPTPATESLFTKFWPQAMGNNANDGKKSAGKSTLQKPQSDLLKDDVTFFEFCHTMRGVMTTASFVDAGLLNADDTSAGGPACHTRSAVHLAILFMDTGVHTFYSQEAWWTWCTRAVTAFKDIREGAIATLLKQWTTYKEHTAALEADPDDQKASLGQGSARRLMMGAIDRLSAHRENRQTFLDLVETWRLDISGTLRVTIDAAMADWWVMPAADEPLLHQDNSGGLHARLCERLPGDVPDAVIARLADEEIIAVPPAAPAPAAPEAAAPTTEAAAPAPAATEAAAPATEAEPAAQEETETVAQEETETVVLEVAPEPEPMVEPMPVDEPASVAADAAEAPRPKRKRNTGGSPVPTRKSARNRSKGQ